MKCYAVVDTNVLVSALLSKKNDTATVQVLHAMLDGRFIPLYYEDILTEISPIRKCNPNCHFSSKKIRNRGFSTADRGNFD